MLTLFFFFFFVSCFLEISSASDVGGQPLPSNPERALEEPASERDHEQEQEDDDGEVPVTNLLNLSPIEKQEKNS